MVACLDLYRLAPLRERRTLKAGTQGRAPMTKAGTKARERKCAERRVREQTDFLRKVLDALRHPFCVIDANDYTIKMANAAARSGESSGITTCHALLHGLSEPCAAQGLPCPLEEVKKIKAPVTVEHIHCDGDGNARTYEIHCHPVFDTEGSVKEVIAYNLDITGRRQAEEAVKTLNESLQQRLAELDAFTYSVSHDLKEPLRGIEAFSQFLLEDYGDRLDAQGREYLVKLANASVRMKGLIDDLLRLSRVSRESRPRTRVNVGRLLEETIEGMQLTIDAKAATVEVEDSLPDVLADRPRIQEVFANLIGNALKFNESEQPFVRVGVRGVGGGMVTFYVQDNGIGIDPKYHERIFGPLRTAARAGGVRRDGRGAGDCEAGGGGPRRPDMGGVGSRRRGDVPVHASRVDGGGRLRRHEGCVGKGVRYARSETGSDSPGGRQPG